MTVLVKGKNLKVLKEERAALIAAARKLNDEHEDDGSLSDDRQAQFDAMIDDASTIKAAIDRRVALSEIEGNAAATQDRLRDAPLDTASGGTQEARPSTVMVRHGRDAKGSPRYIEEEAGPRGSRDYQAAFNRALVAGASGLAPEQLAALQSDDASQAGYLVASEQFASELLKDVDDLLFIRRYARIHTVREPGSLGIRKRATRANTFSWSAELQVSPEDASLSYGKKVLTPHHLTGLMKVSRDLVRRSVVSVDGEVRFEFARDSGEAMEDGYLTGDGNQKPLGVFTASDDGISTARDSLTGSSTGITADGLIAAKYALKSQYRRGERGSLRWLFHRDAIKSLAKLKDANDQYLFRVGAGFAAGNTAPEDSLLGIPVDESERAPNTFTTGQYVGLLANWRYYEIADALDLEIQVLMEKYAETNQIGYIGRIKTDGMPTLEEAFVRLKTD